MITAAGVLILAPSPTDGSDTALLLLRGPGSDHPLEWAFPGGQLEGDETAAEGAARECMEECGLDVDPKKLGVAWARSLAPAQPQPLDPDAPITPVVPSEDVDFTAFRHRVKAQFTPSLCDEHVGYCWAPAAHPPGPTHPGALTALKKLKWHELHLARALASGELMSPIVYENITLFSIRITGTGAAYRRGIKEFVWRDPSFYLHQEFCDRCAGLPVIWVHPDNATLDSKEFSDRVIGTIMLAWIKGDEVWGVARLYDAGAIKAMAENDISTSPTVVLRDPDANVRMELEDGRRVLIEDEADLLDHIAIVPNGVWDKGGAPGGVDKSALETTKADAAAFADALQPRATPPSAIASPGAALALLVLRARALGLVHRHS
jgi:8-oxo-dGTP pyrophosphatase MutT (NUDIX family)